MFQVYVPGTKKIEEMSYIPSTEIFQCLNALCTENSCHRNVPEFEHVVARATINGLITFVKCKLELNGDKLCTHVLNHN